jgi:rhodanese-related sulfurtransferase
LALLQQKEGVMQNINRDEVKKIVDNHEDKVVLIDATSEQDFAVGHIPGAISIPAGKVNELAPKLLKDKGQKIITYCGSTQCPASTIAAEGLEKLGYTDVNEYKPGKADWKAAGFPFEASDEGARAG